MGPIGRVFLAMQSVLLPKTRCALWNPHWRPVPCTQHRCACRPGAQGVRRTKSSLRDLVMQLLECGDRQRHKPFPQECVHHWLRGVVVKLLHSVVSIQWDPAQPEADKEATVEGSVKGWAAIHPPPSGPGIRPLSRPCQTDTPPTQTGFDISGTSLAHHPIRPAHCPTSSLPPSLPPFLPQGMRWRRRRCDTRCAQTSHRCAPHSHPLETPVCQASAARCRPHTSGPVRRCRTDTSVPRWPRPGAATPARARPKTTPGAEFQGKGLGPGSPKCTQMPLSGTLRPGQGPRGTVGWRALRQQIQAWQGAGVRRARG